MVVELGPFRTVVGFRAPQEGDVVAYGFVARDSPRFSGYAIGFDNPKMEYDFYEIGPDGYSEVEPYDPLVETWAMQAESYHYETSSDFWADWGMFNVKNISKDFPDPSRSTIDLRMRAESELSVSRRGILRMEVYRKPDIAAITQHFRAMPSGDWLTVDDFWREMEFNGGLERVNIVEVNLTIPSTMQDIVSMQLHEKNMDTLGPTITLL